jgi:hypothetical protein
VAGFFLFIVNHNHVTEVSVAFITTPKTRKERKKLLSSSTSCLDIGLFRYHEKWMRGWIPHFIVYEMHRGARERLLAVGDVERDDMNSSVREQCVVPYLLIWQG